MICPKGGTFVEDERHAIALVVNGRAVTDEVEPRLLLSQFLRDNLGLTGTHVGCDTSQCGVCTVWMDGLPVKSCTVLAVQADGSEITTVEGLTRDGVPHAVQQAFQREHGLQCGFCTPGALMLSAWHVDHYPLASDAEIREALDGLICRCTGYENIVRAVKRAQAIQEEEPAAMAGPVREGASS
jgi:carbon-monoxide dehydrogenase small subunit